MDRPAEVKELFHPCQTKLGIGEGTALRSGTPGAGDTHRPTGRPGSWGVTTGDALTLRGIRAENPFGRNRGGLPCIVAVPSFPLWLRALWLDG
jgi:hypothetical protein